MTIYITLFNSIIDIWILFRSWNPTQSTENWYSSITRSSVFLSVFTRNVLGKIYFSRNVPISMREEGGEIKLKISLFKMSLFMVGGEGPIEKGPMSWILLFIFLEVVPKKKWQRNDKEINNKRQKNRQKEENGHTKLKEKKT